MSGAGDAWEQVARAADRFYADVLSRLRGGRLEGRASNIFYSALVGRAVSRQSSLERTVVTLLGYHAPEFFKPFFRDVRPLPAPFDFYGVLRGAEYYVKVVSGGDAFNKVTEEYVADCSTQYESPIILTLQGPYFEARWVGRAPWLSAPASWKLVAGPGAYARFRGIVFEAARRYRGEVWELLRGE